jgi:hypothetical protein
MESIIALVYKQKEFESDEIGHSIEDPIVEMLFEKVEMVKKVVEARKHTVKAEDWLPMDPAALKKIPKEKTERVLEHVAPTNREKVKESLTNGSSGNKNSTAESPLNNKMET